MLLTILSWYTLVFGAFGILANIANSKISGGVRVAAIIVQLPVLLFGLLHVLN